MKDGKPCKHGKYIECHACRPTLHVGDELQIDGRTKRIACSTACASEMLGRKAEAYDYYGVRVGQRCEQCGATVDDIMRRAEMPVHAVDADGGNAEVRSEPKVVREKHKLPHGFSLESEWDGRSVLYQWFEPGTKDGKYLPGLLPGNRLRLREWVYTPERSCGDGAREHIRETVARFRKALGGK